jgi:hypothetical protein
MVRLENRNDPVRLKQSSLLVAGASTKALMRQYARADVSNLFCFAHSWPKRDL